MTRIVVAALLALVASLTLAPPASAQADEMTERQAGEFFQDISCDIYRAAVTYNREVYGPDNWIRIPEIRRRLPELRRLTARYEQVYATQSRRLYNPPALWPETVDPLIAKYANVVIRHASALGDMAGANTANQYLERGRRYNRIDFGTTSDRLRAILDLPTPPRGC